MKASPEVQSIESGELRGLLGLPDGADRIQQLIELWSNSVQVKVEKFKLSRKKLEGKITLTAVNKSFSDALNRHDLAEFVTEKMEILPWLRWLLLEGDRPLIQEYTAVLNPRFSRTASYVMKVSPNKDWGVPNQFSGTINNNFVTRALKGIQNDIEGVILKEIQRVL